MSTTITRNHCFLGLSDELAAQHFPDKDGPLDIPSECSVKLVARGSLSSSRDSGYEEIFTCRNRLVWSSHGRVRMRVEGSKCIADAALCPMIEDDASVHLLCMAEPTTLSIYGTEGDIHQHTLPSPVKRLWPTPAGLVVELADMKPAYLIQNSITGLEEITAITSPDAPGPAYAWDKDPILFLSPESPFAVTTRHNGRILRVWCLKAYPEGALPDKQSSSGAPGGKPFADMHSHTPASIYSNRSRVRTPDDHIHPSIFSPFRSQTLPGTGSTIGVGKVYLPSVSVQLAFVLCHVHELQDGVADDACLIQVPDGEVVLAIHTSSQQVIFFSCDSSGNVRKRPETLADISCVSSLDMSASSSSTAGPGTPRRSLLALDAAGRLWLHHGTERLLQVTIPLDTPITPEQVQYFPPARRVTLQGKLHVRTQPDSQFALKSETDDVEELTMRDLGQAVDVSHACGKTFLLHFAGGENVQLHVDVESHTELVGKCVHALQAIMNPPDYRRLLQEYYRGSRLVGDESADWKQFSAFMLRFWKAQLSEQDAPAPSWASKTAEPVDAWQALMALDETQALLQARLYPAFFALVDPVVKGPLIEGKIDAHPQLPVLRGDSRNALADSLGALHSIFEDLSLDMTLWRHLPHLAALLACLSGMLGQTAWQEYYGRHLQAASRLDLLPGSAHMRPLAVLEPVIPPPPSIQNALHNLVAAVPIAPAHAMQLPLLVMRRAGVVQRSIDLLCIFRVLKNTTEELCSLMLEDAVSEGEVFAARRRGRLEILNLLGDLEWKLMDIDCLPFGIALPVHGALQGLREDPPADLSPAKYILLGREDIAATVICMAEAQESQLEGPDPMPLRGEMPGLAALESSSLSAFHTPHLHPPSPSRSTLASGRSTGHSHRGVHRGIKQCKPMWQCSPNGTPVHPVVGTALQEQWASRFVLGPISAQRLGLPGSDLSSPETQSEDHSRAQPDRPTTDDPSLSDLNSQFYRMRFGRDLRLSEALRVLSFSRHVQLPSASNGDAETQAQVKLAFHATRTLALPLGRGALTLNTVNLLPTEPLHAHPITLDGRVPNKNNAVTVFDMAAFASAPCGGAENEMTAWPEFHAGASAALRVIPSSSNLIRYWLLFKKPPTPTYVHAGMLFSLGLSGELKSLSSPNQYRYLCQEHTAIMVGLLVGLAASHRGSMDEATSRTLNMHIPARHASVFGELEIAPLTQAAAMVGLGLLYEGSGHQDTSEMLLHEIVRRPSSSQAGNAGGPNTGGEASAVTVNQDREAYTLSAGFALGLINIGKGRWSSGVSNGSIAETLRRLIVGGAWASTVQPMALWQADQRSSKMPSDDSAPSHGLSQVVLEGSLVNLEVTSPAATIALMLMFLKTNDAAVADMLVLPDTTFNLDFIRPSDILLRVVARSLIMWDSIKPTREWVMQQMPLVIRMRWPAALEEIKAAVAEGREFDHEAVLLAHLHAVTGSCLALGLRYAGTAVEEARATLQEMIIYILQCRKTLAEIKAAVEGFSIDAIIIERMAAVCAMALGSVMSGMGDLKTFKLLRALRKRLNVSDVPINTANATTVSRGYGVHMAIGMSIGFLFLGGACYKFNTSNKSVAMLLISMWPALPCSPSDNRCHLQALRHLYALACNKRVMRAVDVNIRQPVYVPVSLAMASTDHASAVAPGADCESENQPANLQTQAVSSRDNSDRKSSAWAESGPDVPSSPYPNHAVENRSIGLDGLPTCGHTPAGPTVSTSQRVSVTERLSPCLMPEPDLLRGVKVGGSRYWPQMVDAGKHGLLTQALCDRAALFVKKRAHALAYQDDPTGVRSLLSTLVSPAGLASAAVPGSYDLLHICATFSTDPVITSFGLAFCQRDQGGHQHAAWESTRLSEDSGTFLWRLLSEGVMRETAHLLPLQLAVFYSFKTLGDCAWLQQPRPPRKFHFPLGKSGCPFRAPLPRSRDVIAKHDVAAASMPSSPMSEDETMRCEAKASDLPTWPSRPLGNPCTMGWGSSDVATSSGPLQIVQNLVMANAYFAQDNAQGGTASSVTGQAHALEPAFLQSCWLQLEQVWSLLDSKSASRDHPSPSTEGQPSSVMQEALHAPAPLPPSHFLPMADFPEADKIWTAAMVPLYLAFHQANDMKQLKAEARPVVSKLREVLDDSEIAMVLSSATGLPPAVASTLV